jgi:uncharacterized coiled-coil DUF342 family protein
LDDQKEALFHQRSPLSKEISQRIQAVKQLKHERDQLTAEVKKQKENRRGLNELIRQKIEQVKKLHEEKKHLAAKLGLKENPGHIKMQIDRLEQRIETDVMSFAKEQVLMKEIKDLKKRYEASRKTSTLWDQGHALSAEIDELKRQADAIHQEIQQKAQQSQEKHERLLEESKKIDELKKRQEELDAQIAAKKGEIKAAEAKLEPLLRQANDLSSKLFAERKEKEERFRVEQKKRFSDKLAEVKEKMTKGEKLTTEDILVLQGADE